MTLDGQRIRAADLLAYCLNKCPGRMACPFIDAMVLLSENDLFSHAHHKPRETLESQLHDIPCSRFQPPHRNHTAKKDKATP